MELPMPHGLSRNPDGSWEGMFVGEMPWHRLGTVLKRAPASAADAIMAAHLAWRVDKRQLYVGGNKGHSRESSQSSGKTDGRQASRKRYLGRSARITNHCRISMRSSSLTR